MTALKSTKRVRPDKPSKDFPLFPHASGQWAKKIRGRLFYFGVWSDPDAALALYQRQRDDLHAGRKPRVADRQTEGIDLATACNHFLTAKQQLLAAGELSKRSWDDYHRTAQRLVRVFGRSRLVSDLRSDDFGELRNDITSRYGPVATGNEINRVRSIFKFCFDAELIDRPVRFGPTFKRPSAKTIRTERAKNGKRMFTADQLHQLIARASPQLACMILLAINSGLGNSDVAQLRTWHVDLATGWLDFPRPKTGIARRCKLWPETMSALRSINAKRPPAKRDQDDDKVFITKYGKSWHKDSPDNPISKEFRKLAESAGVYRRGLTFYAIRHTFATVAGETGDQIAVNAIMGHVDDSMAARYREHISDTRLTAVANHVHAWLFGERNDG